MQTIRLEKAAWTFNEEEQLGVPGGFGQVFAGWQGEHKVAIKRLKLTAEEAAHRELKIAASLEKRVLGHVVPILDYGQDAESNRYFLVMPLCSESLQQTLDLKTKVYEMDEIASICKSIILGLLEVKDITHRDLKPSNILYHNGVWKVADFGIAKFVQDSTSLETLRDCLTPAYAAPEQWLGEKPTVATDVYALGCIVHALCTGSPPFSSKPELQREGHLNLVPERLARLPKVQANFVGQMLRKPQDARPSLKRCLDVLSIIGMERKDLGDPHRKLINAVSQVEQKAAEEEAKTLRLQRADAKRKQLIEDGENELLRIRNELYRLLLDSSSEASLVGDFCIQLGDAEFQIGKPKRSTSSASKNIFAKDKTYLQASQSLPIMATPLTQSTIGVTQVRPRSRRYTWSATLVFAQVGNEPTYRWYEVSFYPQFTRKGGDAPVALDCFSSDFELALSTAIHTYGVAYGPCGVDGEDQEKFFNRWIELVAAAVTGELSKPTRMPLTEFC